MKDVNKVRFVKKVVFCLLSILLVVSVMYSLALASGGGGAEHGITGAMIKDYLLKILNIAILAFILIFVGKKPLKNALAARGSNLDNEIKEVDSALVKAEKDYEESADCLKRIDEDIEQLTEKIKQEGEIEKENIIKHAQEMAQKIKEQAENAVKHEFELVEKRIKTEIIEKSITEAGKILKEKFKLSDQDKVAKVIANEISKIDGIDLFLHDTSTVLIHSSTDVSDATLNTIMASLKNATSKDIDVEVVKDPSVGGGIITKIGSLVFDASVKTQLKNMKASLKKEVV